MTIKFQKSNSKNYTLIMAFFFCISSFNSSRSQTLQGGVEQNKAYTDYLNNSYQSGVSQNNTNMQPFQTGASVNLPPQFLGSWQVQANRIKVEAAPEFQQGANNAFAVTPPVAIWTISGNQSQGYSFSSNTGASCSITVDKADQNTAFFRYSHPIGNTTAQEAVVLQLGQNGSTFAGLERISIVKQGISQPRAKVTYNLFGSRN